MGEGVTDPRLEANFDCKCDCHERMQLPQCGPCCYHTIPIKRIAGWEFALAAEIAPAKDRTFKWGDFDCGLFVCD